jgi:hypothetical protein
MNGESWALGEPSVTKWGSATLDQITMQGTEKEKNNEKNNPRNRNKQLLSWKPQTANSGVTGN